MITKFPSSEFFDPNNDDVADGFRISHSHKSLSIFSKHLWCLNLIDEPVFCAVDGIILRKTDAPTHIKRTNIKRTNINNIEAQRENYECIEAQADKSAISIARWELSAFAVD